MAKAVLGLGFGDEGKGLVTDYLASKDPRSLVVRFSGGHQAGHNVVTDTAQHIFASFGSGTLRGSPTHWSRFCTVHPTAVINEMEILKTKGIKPTCYIDGKCPITTPYDIYSNQLLNSITGHGTVGVGVGKTWKREEDMYSLLFEDLFYPAVLRFKMAAIKEYYNAKIIPDYKKFFEEEVVPFLWDCHQLVTSENINMTYGYKAQDMRDGMILPDDQLWRPRIYEGSQGLLLDQNIGFFPNVTWGNTGMKNALELEGDYFDEIFLVTRAYQTRHGSGPMTNEAALPFLKEENIHETNKSDHKFQGKFRRGILDLDLIIYAINKDPYLRENKDKCTLVITCLDHMDKFQFTYRGTVCDAETEDSFITRVGAMTDVRGVMVSRSNNSKYMERVF